MMTAELALNLPIQHLDKSANVSSLILLIKQYEPVFAALSGCKRVFVDNESWKMEDMPSSPKQHHIARELYPIGYLVADLKFPLSVYTGKYIWTALYKAGGKDKYLGYAFAKMVISAYACQGLKDPAWKNVPAEILVNSEYPAISNENEKTEYLGNLEGIMDELHFYGGIPKNETKYFRFLLENWSVVTSVLYNTPFREN